MRSHHTARKWVAGTAAVAGLGLVVGVTGTPGYAKPGSGAYRAAVSPEGIAEHLDAFQDIADANGGTRASGTPGYDASVDYVVERLEAAGYSPRVQDFEFPFFEERSASTLVQTSPDATTYANPDDFSTMTYSAAGEVTDTVVQAVDTTFTAPTPPAGSTSGCEASDFAGFTAGNVALMQRGTCPFATKVANADAAGAVAAIIFNSGLEGQTGPIAGTLGAPAEIPALGTSFAVGQDLGNPAGTRVSLTTDTISEIRETYNVHADTRKGKAERVVQAGAHLDSVSVGPGINDNGSGSAALLEAAEAMAEEQPRNRVRFSWWGAEELGLLGSEHYVADLVANDPDELERTWLYLNFDMVGSPNYVRFIYDGDNSKFGPAEGAAIGPEGSGAIEKVFTDYFASQDLASEETPFSGRSDYGPFIAEGVPSGGLFTGAEGVKTAEQAAVYGGTAGLAYDPCYHQECDDRDNVNMSAIDEMSDAMAHAVYTYAQAKSIEDPRVKVKSDKAVGGMRAQAHDYDAPNHHAKRR